MTAKLQLLKLAVHSAKTIWIIAAGLILLVISVWICFLLLFSPSWWPRVEFNPNAWSQHAKGERYSLYKSLAESGCLDGDKESVASCLGEPDYEVSQGRYFIYTLKNTRAMGVSTTQLLVIEFDRENRAIKYSIETD